MTGIAPAGVPVRPVPDDFRPQLPWLVGSPPEGDDWLHEIKFDGYRIIARIDRSGVRLVTRRGHDWTGRFRKIAHALDALGLGQTLVDGEVALLLADGTTDFEALQTLDVERTGRLRYYLFDLPWYRGHDLTEEPLLARKEALRQLLRPTGSDDPLRLSDHIRGGGSDVFRRACAHGLEGIVSKRADARYRQGRARSWLKVKCRNRREYVIGGWTDPSGSRMGLGALLVGWYEDERTLRYAGKVGSGFSTTALADLRRRLDEIPAVYPPFIDPPAESDPGTIHWVEPTKVVEVEAGGRTREGRLRHASFQGLREDKAPSDVGPEPPAPERPRNRPSAGRSAPRIRGGANLPIRVAGVRLSHPDRVLYPEQGVTKRALSEYYLSVADRILPHLSGRALSLVRCPRGREEGPCFFQKHVAEGMPDAVRGADGSITVTDAGGLVSLVQLGVLEIHPRGARADRPDRPDRLIFDLDPGEGVPWPAVVQAARRLRDFLSEIGLETWVRTTGGKGVHLVTPLRRRSSWSQVKGFARDVARTFERRDPSTFTATSSHAARRGRIYVDYLRNSRSATAIASFSTRARRGAPVAVPLAWDELSHRRPSDSYDVKSLPRRLARLRRDPWEGFFEAPQTLTRQMRRDAGG